MTPANGFSDGAVRHTPVIRAAEAAECGLACIAMVAARYGYRATLDQLRQQFPVSLAGANLRSLLDISAKLGLSARAIRVEAEDLPSINLPAVLHWNMHHFVVLTGFRGSKAVLNDPARGRVVVSRAEISNAFTGVAVEFTPGSTFQKLDTRRPLRITDLWSTSSGIKRSLVSVVIMSVALQLLAFLLPFHIQMTVDRGLSTGDTSFVNLLGAAFLAVIIIHAVVEAGRAWSVGVFSACFSYSMLGNIVSHLIRLKATYFEKRHLGDILSRIQSSRSIQDFLTRGVVTVFIDGVMAMITLVILLQYSGALTGLVLLGAVLGGLISIMSYYAIKDKTQHQLVASAKEQTHLMETIRSAVTIKMMGRENAREGHWRSLFSESLSTGLAVNRTHLVYDLAKNVVRGSMVVILLWVGAILVISEASSMTLGMLIAYMSFSQTFSDRISSLMTEAVQFRLLGVHLERLSDIAHSEAEDLSGGHEPASSPGDIEFRDVSFRYGSGERDVLDSASLRILPGEYVAIRGRSGAGKTTFLKLLVGVLSQNAGEIRLGGRLTSDGVFRAWRARIGIVSQDDRLLAGSIEENITFFDPEPDHDRVRESARDAGVIEDILQMPMQFRSLVGDMGSALSAGQKQRVLLARALYRQPDVLILDEGTANLDDQTESEIADLIRKMTITRVVVAHRPLLLEQADRLLSLENGRFREVRG